MLPTVEVGYCWFHMVGRVLEASKDVAYRAKALKVSASVLERAHCLEIDLLRHSDSKSKTASEEACANSD